MAIDFTDFTTGTPAGDGYFDKLMLTIKGHIEQEYAQSRLRGPEYATVYLGLVTAAMDKALQFTLAKEQTELQNALLEEQIETTDLQQIQIEKQTLNIVAEGLNIPKQGNVLDAQTALTEQQKLNLISEELGIDANTALTTQKTLNAVTEETVLEAQKCKLDAEFDLLEGQVVKTTSEVSLLNQKTLTEAAQISNTGVAADSVVGKQKALYTAQTDAYAQDALQKAADVAAGVFKIQASTQDASGTSTNKFDDPSIGALMSAMAAGVGVSL